jgi:hypothetical protein
VAIRQKINASQVALSRLNFNGLYEADLRDSRHQFHRGEINSAQFACSFQCLYLLYLSLRLAVQLRNFYLAEVSLKILNL